MCPGGRLSPPAAPPPSSHCLARGDRGTLTGTQDKGEGGQGHTSSLPGPEPCCWLHRSLSQPRTKISLDTASDRLAPATLAGRRRHTENRLLSLLSSPFPTFLTQQISSSLAASPSHHPQPLAPGAWPSPLDSDAESLLSDSRLCPPSRRPQSSLEMSLLQARPPRRRRLCLHTQLTCVCRDRQGLALGPEPGGAGRVGQTTGKTQSPENKLLQASPLGSFGSLTARRGLAKPEAPRRQGWGTLQRYFVWSEYSKAVPARKGRLTEVGGLGTDGRERQGLETIYTPFSEAPPQRSAP